MTVGYRRMPVVRYAVRTRPWCDRLKNVLWIGCPRPKAWYRSLQRGGLPPVPRCIKGAVPWGPRHSQRGPKAARSEESVLSRSATHKAETMDSFSKEGRRNKTFWDPGTSARHFSQGKGSGWVMLLKPHFGHFILDIRKVCLKWSEYCADMVEQNWIITKLEFQRRLLIESWCAI